MVYSSEHQKVAAQRHAQKYVINQAHALKVDLLRAYQPALILSTFIQLVRSLSTCNPLSGTPL